MSGDLEAAERGDTVVILASEAIADGAEPIRLLCVGDTYHRAFARLEWIGSDCEVDPRVATERDLTLAPALAQAPDTVCWRAEPGDDWIIGWQASRDTVREIHTVLDRGPWDDAMGQLVAAVRGHDWETTLQVLPGLSRAEARAEVVWAAVVQSPTILAACQIVQAGLRDRSAIVRETACRAAAYSQQRSLLSDLRNLFDYRDPGVRRFAPLASYAIRAGNHHIAFPDTDTRLGPTDRGPRPALLNPIAALIRDIWFAIRGERSTR